MQLASLHGAADARCGSHCCGQQQKRVEECQLHPCAPHKASPYCPEGGCPALRSWAGHRTQRAWACMRAGEAIGPCSHLSIPRAAGRRCVGGSAWAAVRRSTPEAGFLSLAVKVDGVAASRVAAVQAAHVGDAVQGHAHADQQLAGRDVDARDPLCHWVLHLQAAQLSRPGAEQLSGQQQLEHPMHADCLSISSAVGLGAHTDLLAARHGLLKERVQLQGVHTRMHAGLPATLACLSSASAELAGDGH